ncbi:hypothetical protein AB6A23_06960 [Paenibacillus tarimensis]
MEADPTATPLYDLTIGRTFLHDKSYFRFTTMRELVDRTEPEPLVTAKPSLGIKPLPIGVTVRLGRLDGLAAEERSETEESEEKPVMSGIEMLAALLHYTLGLLRYEVGSVHPFHRATPSPRCRYATELYVCIGEKQSVIDSEMAGIYRYHPVKHALETRRQGDYMASLAQAAGVSLSGVDFIIVVVSDFWRLACIYDDFSFHLAALEAGHVLGQLQLVGRAAGCRVHCHYGFVDSELERLIGLRESEECAMALLMFECGGHATRESGAAPRVHAGRLEAAPVSHSGESGFNARMAQCPELLAMVRASRITTRKELDYWRSYGGESELPPQCREARSLTAAAFTPGSEKRPVSDMGSAGKAAGLIRYADNTGKWNNEELADALRTRSGANDVIGLTAGSCLEWGDLSRVLKAYYSDRDPAWITCRNAMRLFAAVNRVNGLPSGIYEVDSNGLGLLPVRQGDISALLEEAYEAPGRVLNARSIPLSFFIAVHYESCLERYGNRGYQLLHLEVGRAAQYLAVLAGGAGWFLRPVKGYDDLLTEELLGLLRSPFTVAYQLLAGENRTPYLSFDLSLL